MALNIVAPLSIQLQMHQQMLFQQQQMALHHYQQDELANSNAWANIISVPNVGPKLQEDVQIELENKKLWQQFHAETTEMIITKTGRRMFPSVQLSVQGLERRTRYCMLLELAPASSRRHKYVGGGGGGESQGPTARGWTSAGPAEPQPVVERRLYVHPDSPATGAHWMQHPVSFSKLKLTNNVVEHHSNMLLTSMHKYIPRIWIIRSDEISNIRDLYNNPSSCFSFRETEFIAVTAYQNENITKLKIDNNPFAKGFRESGQSACKRKRQRLGHEDAASLSNSDHSHDEEEANDAISSSDSDHPDSPKRTRRCSLTSSGNPTPPPPQRIQLETKPRLHRPWTDDDEETAMSNRNLETTPAFTLGLPVQHHPHGLFGLPSESYRLMYESATQMMYQRLVAASQMPRIMDLRR